VSLTIIVTSRSAAQKAPQSFNFREKISMRIRHF
jgi:hypothetical protein